MKTIELKNGNHIELDSLITKIATYLFVVASNETQNGSWVIYYEEIAEAYEISEETVKDNAEAIYQKTMELFDECIADIDCGEDYFDLNLYHNFCIGYIEDDQSIEENRD